MRDIEDVALPMRDLLQELGHDMLLAGDGPSALKLLATSGPVDVALLVKPVQLSELLRAIGVEESGQ
ncbi:hypothetical protein WKW80_17140 [Variovorax humicola]|uniref:Response regulatory domain-containing protein n=1 Tax=Variovorax humicola TaxID=1769758 RepID=A0ABU8W1G4_9BURK